MKNFESILIRVVRSIQWSGQYLDGTGCRMGFAEIDGTRYAACPVCGGIDPKQTAPDDIYKGHRPHCVVGRVLREHDANQRSRIRRRRLGKSKRKRAVGRSRRRSSGVQRNRRAGSEHRTKIKRRRGKRS